MFGLLGAMNLDSSFYNISFPNKPFFILRRLVIIFSKLSTQYPPYNHIDPMNRVIHPYLPPYRIFSS